MRQFNITTGITELAYEELSDGDRRLVALARQATYRSYSPYSHFSVGAAIELDNGETVCGSNQENAAFTSGTCAERSACFYAHSRYPDVAFTAIAIAARGTDGNETPAPISPCGHCRQALLEFETLAGHDVRVILAGADRIYIAPSVRSLLPLAFTDF